MASVSLSFPDSTYSSSNKPSADTIKSDFSSIETAINETDTTTLRKDGSVSLTGNQVQTATPAAATHLATMGAIYPVGSIYINATVSTNPATLLGFGTWEAWGVGRALVGVNAGDSDFISAGTTGGSKTVDSSHQHAMPHTHTFSGTTSQINTTPVKEGTGSTLATTNHSHTYSGTTGGVSTANTAIDGTETLSVVQPYQCAHIWKRTA